MSLTPQETVKIIDDSINAADKALDLYNKVVDQVVPWNAFEETIKEIERFKDEYSTEASTLVGETKTLLLDAQDKYFQSSQSVYRWCGLTLQLMPVFIKSLDIPEQAETQRTIITKVLDDGIQKIEVAIDLLGKSSETFNKTSGKLTELDARLGNDFDTKSGYFKSKVDKIRKDAYGGAAAGVIAGPFGLIISYSIAAGVVEGKLIPELVKKLNEVKNFFLSLRNKVNNANKEIGDVKIQLNEEVKSLGELQSQVAATKVMVDLSKEAALKQMVVESASSLINSCNTYQIRHGRS